MGVDLEHLQLHHSGKENSNADALSRLPAPLSQKEPPELAKVMHLMEYLDSSPVSSAQIWTWTDQDTLLSKVKGWILSGWPDPTPSEEEELKPFSRRRYELSVEDGCVLWGSRVVVPPKGKARVLQMLHEAHPSMPGVMCVGRVSMKSLKSVLNLVKRVKSIGNSHQQRQCIRGPGLASLSLGSRV